MTNKIYKTLYIVNLLTQICGTVASIAGVTLIGIFLDNDHVAGYGLCNIYVPLSYFIGFVFTNGCNFLCTRLLGKGNSQEARKVFSTTAVTLFILSVFVSILGIIFSNPIVRLFGANNDSAYLAPLAQENFIGLLIGLPFNTLYLLLSPIVTLDGAGKRATISCVLFAFLTTLFSFIAMLITDSLLILEIFTAVAYFIADIVMFTKLLKKDSTFRFSFRDFSFKYIKPVIAGGFGGGLIFLCFTVIQILENNFANIIDGANGVTAMSVAHTCWTILCCFVVANASSLSVISSMYYGERDKASIKKSFFNWGKYLVIVQVPVVILFVIFAKQFSMIYIKDNDVALQLSTLYVRAAAIGTLFSIFNTTMVNYIQAIGLKVRALLYPILYVATCSLFGKILMPLLFKTTGMFFSWMVGEFSCFCIYCLILVFMKKKLGVKLFDRILALPNTFNLKKEDVLETKINTKADIFDFSTKVTQSCKDHNVDSKRMYKLCLCIEEMVTNIIDHGFVKDSKKHIIEVKVLFENDDIILRIRDDCVRFNLKEKSKILEANRDDPSKNIGIKMVLNIAKDVQHVYALSTNNLIIRV